MSYLLYHFHTAVRHQVEAELCLTHFLQLQLYLLYNKRVNKMLGIAAKEVLWGIPDSSLLHSSALDSSVLPKAHKYKNLIQRQTGFICKRCRGKQKGKFENQ